MGEYHPVGKDHHVLRIGGSRLGIVYYIFGAHSRGRTLYEYLKTLMPQDRMLGFLYDDEEKNPSQIEGFAVTKLTGVSANEGEDVCLNRKAKVFIATRGEYHEKIIKRLSGMGFTDIECVTVQLDILLRNRYVERVFKDRGKTFHKISPGPDVNGIQNGQAGYSDERKKACIFVARTEYDMDFENPVQLNSYEQIIQAGNALATVKIPEAEYRDDEGDNISERNRQCCELTVLYWVWKHALQDIVGLEHWRRRFLLPEDWTDVMDRDGLDVILPVPLCVMPSLEENFKNRHLPYIWDGALEIIKRVYPEEHDRARDYFRYNSLYSPCNMLIARKAVLDEYCSWLFPVILELNDKTGVVEDKYQNRYPGFVAERLLTYFFDAHGNRYKTAYADKSFLK